MREDRLQARLSLQVLSLSVGSPCSLSYADGAVIAEKPGMLTCFSPETVSAVCADWGKVTPSPLWPRIHCSHSLCLSYSNFFAFLDMSLSSGCKNAFSWGWICGLVNQAYTAGIPYRCQLKNWMLHFWFNNLLISMGKHYLLKPCARWSSPGLAAIGKLKQWVEYVYFSHCNAAFQINIVNL